MSRRLVAIGAAVVLAVGAVVVALVDRPDDTLPTPTDPDVLVLTPATDGGQPHTHTTVVGTGTTAAAGGYELTDVRMPRTTGPGELSFRITSRAGVALTDYTEEQTKLLHLYVVRTDYSDFRHLHPTLAADGTWRTRLDLADPGRYRVIAEFVPGDRKDGAHVVLASDVTVPGAWTPAAVPDANAATDGVVEVTGPETITAGTEQQIQLTVSDGNDGVVNLGTYLGAYAHLTGFDVATGQFVHAHPLGAPKTTKQGSALTFHTTFTTPGRYRLFVQVRVDGFVHSLAVTTRVVAG